MHSTRNHAPSSAFLTSLQTSRVVCKYYVTADDEMRPRFCDLTISGEFNSSWRYNNERVGALFQVTPACTSVAQDAAYAKQLQRVRLWYMALLFTSISVHSLLVQNTVLTSLNLFGLEEVNWRKLRPRVAMVAWEPLTRHLGLVCFSTFRLAPPVQWQDTCAEETYYITASTGNNLSTLCKVGQLSGQMRRPTLSMR